MVPNIEVYQYLPCEVRMRDPWPRVPHPDVQGYSTRDYGNRIGFWRMLDVLDRYEVPCTISLNISAYECFPEIYVRPLTKKSAPDRSTRDPEEDGLP